MIDPILNRRLDNCRKLMKAWHRFHSYITQVMKGAEFDAKAEGEFLQLKSQIAILHDSFVEAADVASREVAATTQNIITLVEGAIMIRHLKRMNVAELKKMEMEWHEAYLLINDTIGILEEQVNHLEKINHAHHLIELFATRGMTSLSRMVGHVGFKIAVGVLAVLLAAIVLPLAGVYDYNFLESNDKSKGYYWKTRNILRKTVARSMAFRSWKDYEEYGRPTFPGFTKQDVAPTEKDGIRSAFLREHEAFAALYTEIGPPEIGSILTKATHVELERFTKEGVRVSLMTLLFPDTAAAMDLGDAMTMWKAKIPEGSETAQHEAKIRGGRYVNVYYFAFCENPAHLNTIGEQMEEGKVKYD